MLAGSAAMEVMHKVRAVLLPHPFEAVTERLPVVNPLLMRMLRLAVPCPDKIVMLDGTVQL
jgi:hypothetical protein